MGVRGRRQKNEEKRRVSIGVDGAEKIMKMVGREMGVERVKIRRRGIMERVKVRIEGMKSRRAEKMRRREGGGGGVVFFF